MAGWGAVPGLPFTATVTVESVCSPRVTVQAALAEVRAGEEKDTVREQTWTCYIPGPPRG